PPRKSSGSPRTGSRAPSRSRRSASQNGRIGDDAPNSGVGGGESIVGDSLHARREHSPPAPLPFGNGRGGRSVASAGRAACVAPSPPARLPSADGRGGRIVAIRSHALRAQDSELPAEPVQMSRLQPPYGAIAGLGITPQSRGWMGNSVVLAGRAIRLAI